MTIIAMKTPDNHHALCTLLLKNQNKTKHTDAINPEVKELKRRVRDIIDPARDLGHVDRTHNAAAPAKSPSPSPSSPPSTTVMSLNTGESNSLPASSATPHKDTSGGTKNPYAPPTTELQGSIDGQRPITQNIEHTASGDAIMAGVPIPGPVSQFKGADEKGSGEEEGGKKRKYIPMDVDSNAGLVSRGVDESSSGKGDGEGVCKPGDECWEG